MMYLELIYNIVCKKGMTIYIQPEDLIDDAFDSIRIKLMKDGKHIVGIFPMQILLVHSDPQTVLKENIEMMAETLEEKINEDNKLS